MSFDSCNSILEKLSTDTLLHVEIIYVKDISFNIIITGWKQSAG